MPLLVDIAREHTRCVALGLRPIIILASPKTHVAIMDERVSLFGDAKGRLLGLEPRTEFLGDGVFRLLVDYKGVKEMNV